MMQATLPPGTCIDANPVSFFPSEMQVAHVYSAP